MKVYRKQKNNIFRPPPAVGFPPIFMCSFVLAKILAEASPYDSVWGIGLTADDPRALVQRSWQGLNKLGDALMDVRRQLKEDMYNADTYNYRRSNVRENEEDGKNDDGGGMISFGEVNTIGNHR